MFPKIGVVNPPKWMVKIMENPIKMDDLGVPTPIFGNTYIDESLETISPKLSDELIHPNGEFYMFCFFFPCHGLHFC